MCSTTEATSNQNSLATLDDNRKSSVFLNVDSTDCDNFSNHIASRQNDISDSYIVFDAHSERNETNDKESVITMTTSDKESSIKSSDLISQKPTRPNSLTFDQNSSPPLHNPNKVYLYIQMQLCQRQSLKEWLAINKDRDYNYVLKIFEQILQAVEYVHLRGLIHRDLKPSNIFFSLDDQIKVGDFGLVTAMTENDGQVSPCGSFKLNLENEKHTAQVGTQLYMSPEQLSGKPYNYKVDIYSLGLILFELLVPFNTQMERIHVLQDIKQNKFTESFQKLYKDEVSLIFDLKTSYLILMPLEFLFSVRIIKINALSLP